MIRVSWKKFGNAIEQARGHRGLSIRDLAAETSLSPSTVWRAEQGYKCSVEVYLTLIIWLRVDSELFLA